MPPSIPQHPLPSRPLPSLPSRPNSVTSLLNVHQESYTFHHQPSTPPMPRLPLPMPLNIPPHRRKPSDSIPNPELTKPISQQPPSLMLHIPRPLNSKRSPLQYINPSEVFASAPSLFDPHQGSLRVEQTNTRPKSAPTTPLRQNAHDDSPVEFKTLDPFFSDDLTDDDFEELGYLGDHGRVHKVRYKQTGVILARKIIFTRDVPERQVTRGLNISAIADHDNIVKSYGAYSSPSAGEVRILMEFCPGRSLDDIGKQMRKLGAVVGEKIYGRIAEGILQGLDYLQRKKVIHRDIRPQNVLLSQSGVVKLCDFGTSGELLNSYAATFTEMASVYLSPERISGADYTIRSDVWSTGITLLEFVQGKSPFPSDLAPTELMMHIISLKDAPRLEDTSSRSWSDDMKDFIKQMLNVDFHVRPPPNVMLRHAWITNVMAQEVDMARWIRIVWDWPKPLSRRTRDRSVS